MWMYRDDKIQSLQRMILLIELFAKVKRYIELFANVKCFGF